MRIVLTARDRALLALVGSVCSFGCKGSDEAGAEARCTTNSLAIGAPMVQTVVARASAVPPSPTGGTITSGTYHATSAAFYADGDCAYIDEDSAEAYVITALTDATGTVEAAGKAASGEETHASLRYAITDSVASLELICPIADSGAASPSVSFSATPSEIRLFVAKTLPTGEACGTHVTLLVKQ